MYVDLCPSLFAPDHKFTVPSDVSNRIAWRALGGIFCRRREHSGTSTRSSGAMVHDSNGVAGEIFM
jgi:hypothetical protein